MLKYLKILSVLIFLSTFLFLANFAQAKTSDNNNSDTLGCEAFGQTNVTCALYVPVSGNFQAYGGDFNFSVIAGNNPSLSNQYCLFRPDFSLAECSSGDVPVFPNQQNASFNRSIGKIPGTNVDNFEGAVIYFQADDLFLAAEGFVHGRRVEVLDLSAPSPVGTSSNFNISWDTDWSLGTRLYYGGAISSCEYASGVSVPDSDTISCTAGTSTGDITIEVRANGPGSGGSVTDNMIVGVSVTAAGGTSPLPGSFNLSGSCSVVNSSENSADLDWTVSSDADSYKVERKAWSTGSWNQAGTTTGTSFSENVSNGADYYYRVFAINSAGSTFSSPTELFVCGAVAGVSPPPSSPPPSSPPPSSPPPSSPPPEDPNQAILGVNSSGISGAAITQVGGSPSGLGGATNYTRSYTTGISARLRAPLTAGGVDFTGWTGCDSTQGSGQRDCNISVNVGQVKTITADYPSGPPPSDGPPPPACTDNHIYESKSIPDSITLSPGQTYDFNVVNKNLGPTWWYHGASYQYVQLSNLDLNPGYGHITPSMHTYPPTNTQQEDFTLTAPIIPSAYNLQMRMVHRLGSDYELDDGTVCAPAPSQDVYFGELLNVTVNVVPTPGQVSLTAVPSTVSPGGPVSVSWSGVTNPKTTDWIALYVPGQSDGEFYNEPGFWLYFYTSSCGQSPGPTAKASGSCPVSMPFATNTYEFRIFGN